MDAEAGDSGPPAGTPWEGYGFLLIPDFLVLSASFLFLAYGCSAPAVYLVPFSLGVGVGEQRAAVLMSLFGVGGIVGNVTFGWIADRKCLRRYRVMSYAAAIGMEGVCCLLLQLLRSFSLLLPFSLLYGYFDGTYVALIPVVTSDVVGSSYLTSALGVVYFLHAIPYLLSPPIGGWLVDVTGNSSAPSPCFSPSPCRHRKLRSNFLPQRDLLHGQLRDPRGRHVGWTLPGRRGPVELIR